jgi:flagellar hook-length control protein FliK
MARLDALRQALPQAVGEIAKQLTISSGQAVQGKIVRVEVVLPETARQTQVASPEESETHRAAVPFDLFTSGAGQPGGRTEAQSIAWLSKALAPPKAAVGEASATVLLPDEGEPATVPLSDGLRLTVSRLPGAQTAESATIVLTLSGDTDESPVLTVKLSFSVLSGSRLEEPAATLMAGKTATESLQPAIGPGLRNPQSEANLGLLRPQPGVSPSVVQLQPAPLPAAGPDWHALGEQKAGPARGIQVAATADQAGLKSNLPQPVTPGDPPREAVSPVLRQVGLLPAMPLDETTTAKAAAVQASSGSVNKGTAVEFAKVRLNPLAVSAGNPAAEAADAKPALKPNAPAITAVEVAEAAPAADKPAVPGADGPDGRPPTTTAPTPQIGLGDSQTSPALPPQLLQFTSPVPQPDYSGALRAALGRINELVQHYKAAGEGLYNAQLELDPPALGKLFINVLVRGDNVAIQVAAVSPASREQLQAGAAQLRQGLIDSGLNVAEMRIVSLDPEDGQSGAGHDSSSQQEGQGNQRGNKSAPRWEPPQKVASSA